MVVSSFRAAYPRNDTVEIQWKSIWIGGQGCSTSSQGNARGCGLDRRLLPSRGSRVHNAEFPRPTSPLSLSNRQSDTKERVPLPRPRCPRKWSTENRPRRSLRQVHVVNQWPSGGPRSLKDLERAPLLFSNRKFEVWECGWLKKLG